MISKTGHVVTAVFTEITHQGEVPLGTRKDSLWTYAYTPEDRARLADAVLSSNLRHPHLPAKRQIYVWDRPCRSSTVLSEQYGFVAWHSEGEDEFPDHRLRIVIEPSRKFGALHYYGPTTTGDIGIWVTRTPHPVPTEEPLYYDSDSDTKFPTDALMPIPELRPAIAEHLDIGVRPDRVDWQPFHVL